MSHKPVTINITGGTPVGQEAAKITRKSLKTLQHTATDKENLTGRPARSIKDFINKDKNLELLEVKRKKVLSKKTQAGSDDKISEDDLTNLAGPSENYWEVLAGKRQIALQETLDENEKLWKIIDDLKEENVLLKQMLDEANSFVEVFKEMVDDNNDTGIDVKDISTANETANTSISDETVDASIADADVSTAYCTADTSIADVSISYGTADSAADETVDGVPDVDPDYSNDEPSEKKAKEE